jgi:hypothetical protein
MWPRAVHADGINVQSMQAKSSFPDGIVMTITASSNAKITSTRLKFHILPENPVTQGKVECTGDAVVNCKSTIGGAGGAYVVPFAEIRYQWEITDQAGQTMTTEEKSVTYDDARFKWQSVADGNLTAYYYAGDEKTARDTLKIARDTIDKMSKLENTQITFPVKLLMYNTVRDLQPAVASSRTKSPNSVTLGEVAAADTALVSREILALDTVRHEVTHIVTDHATRTTPGQLAIWINEGISMWAQNDLEPDEKRALDAAIKNNSVYPISTLTSSAPRTNDPSLFYSEARSIIKFMIDSQGEGKFTDFINALKDGGTEDALKKAYGWSQADLENNWRKSVGLAPVTPTAGGASGGTVLTLPTLTPFGSDSPSVSKATPASGGGAQTSSSGSSGGGGSSTLPIIVGAVIAVMVVGGGAAVVMRGRKKPAA